VPSQNLNGNGPSADAQWMGQDAGLEERIAAFWRQDQMLAFGF